MPHLDLPPDLRENGFIVHPDCPHGLCCILSWKKWLRIKGLAEEEVNLTQRIIIIRERKKKLFPYAIFINFHPTDLYDVLSGNIRSFWTWIDRSNAKHEVYEVRFLDANDAIYARLVCG